MKIEINPSKKWIKPIVASGLVIVILITLKLTVFAPEDDDNVCPITSATTDLTTAEGHANFLADCELEMRLSE